MKGEGLQAVVGSGEVASGERGMASLWKSKEGIGLGERVGGYTPCVTESVRNRMMGKGLRRFWRVLRHAHRLLEDRESIDTGTDGMDERRVGDVANGDFNAEGAESMERGAAGVEDHKEW